MARISSLGIRVSGEFRDLWLYKGHLYAWQRDGILFYCELKDLLSYIAGRYGPTVANATQILIVRNDWKASEQFRTMMAAPPMLAAFLEPFKAGDQIILDVPVGLLKRSASEPYTGPVLDTAIYADHVFFATTEGLLQTFVDPEDPEAEFSVGAQGFSGRASAVSVRYSAINVSSEDQGLHFGRLNSRHAAAKTFYKSSFQKLASVSRESSYAGHDLLNFGAAAAPDFFRADIRELDEPQDGRRQQSDRFEIVGYRDPVSLDTLAFSAAIGKQKVTRRGVMSTSSVDTEDMEVLGNNNGQLLLSWNDRFRVVRMSVVRDMSGDMPEDIEASQSKSYKGLQWSEARPSQALQTLPVNRGFVVELENSVVLIQHDGVYPLGDRPVAQIRTFASSVRHKEVVATVEEECLTVTGYYLSEDTLF